MNRLEGKIALVTGAGSGIGRGCAMALAAEGARVIVTDVDEKGGRETCEEIGKAAQFHKLDVSDEGAWKDIAALIRKETGALHVLVKFDTPMGKAPAVVISDAVSATSISPRRFFPASSSSAP